MGTIKDIADLCTQLAKSIKDRELASKLFEIQSLIAQFQSENIALQKEILDLKKENHEITEKLNNKKQKVIFHANLLWLPDDKTPYCSTCYDSDNKLIHQHTYENRLFHCPKCGQFNDMAKQP